MNTIQFQNNSIYFTNQGNGPTLVLLHGFCEDQSVWDSFKQDFLKSYQVITIDLPGFGKSEAPNTATIDYMAEGVEAVLNTLGIKQFILIGHSMGAYVSLAFSAKFPDRLLGLGLFHSHCFADAPAKKEGRNKGIEFVSKHGTALYVKQVIPSLFASDYFINNAALISTLIEKASNYSPEGIINALKAMRDKQDQSTILKDIEIPVLFIIGRKDLVAPQEKFILQTTFPNIASIHILDEVGHMGMFEAPRQCQAIISEFSSFCLSKVEA